MDKESKRRVGRYIKRNDPILELMSVSEFKLAEVNKFEMLIPDNTKNSVIHTRMHMPQDVIAALKPYPYDNSDITPKDMFRQVLTPVDFTADWRRMRARSTKKNTYLDDEDFFYFEAVEKNQNKDANGDDQDDSDGGESGEEGDENPKATSLETKGGDAASKANQRLIATEVKLDEHHQHEKRILDTVAAELSYNEDQFLGSGLVVGPPKSVRSPIDHVDGKNPSDSQEVNHPNPPTPEEIEDIKRAGFEEGFASGREQGINEGKTQIEQASQHMGDLLGQLESLKKDVLRSAQDNFRTICVTMVESLLQKEVMADPQALNDIIKRAIDEAVPEDHYKVRVHPDMYAQLLKTNSAELKGHLEADASLDHFDFKIESKNGVIDGRMKQLISDLLKQADIDLFKPNANPVTEEAS